MNRRRLPRLIAVLAGTLVALIGVAAPARAADQITAYVANAQVNPDGSLQVRATITFGQAAPAVFEQVLSTRVRTADQLEYRFELSDITVTAGGQALPVTVTPGPASTTLSAPTAGLSAPIEVGYTVRGAAIATAKDTTTITWALLQGLSQPVATFEGTIGVPGQFTMIDCGAGDLTALGACGFYGGGTHDNPNPFFHDENRAPGEVVVAVVRFPSATVAANDDVRELWTAERGFSVAPLPLATAAGLLALGAVALWAAHRRFGRDAVQRSVAAPTLVAEFAPVGHGRSEFRVLDRVRPGEVGTLADERVDPVDVTATVLDLAVRGHLRITELPHPAFGPTDWTLTRQASNDPLADYEATLLAAVAPVAGQSTAVSQLAGPVAGAAAQVQSELYDEVVARGWFAQRPDATRGRWHLIGWVSLAVAVVAAVLLAAFTRFGLAGLVLVAVALGLVLLAQEMPARTAAGSSILGGLEALRAVLQVQPTESVTPGADYSGLSTVLPYAIVLGVKDRWLKALVAADPDADEDATALSWYHGPDGWHLADLPDSLANFITTLQGTLFSR